MTPASLAASAAAAVLRAELDDRATRRTDPAQSEALDRHHAVIDGLIAGHGGRPWDIGGGLAVAGFADPAAAVRCATLIQQHLEALEAERGGPGPLAWRIAVGLSGDELAPLIAAAGPGEVRITVALYAGLRGRLGLGVAPLEAPSAGFRVLADPATGPRRVWLYRAGALHNAALVLVLALFVTALAVMVWHLVLAPAGG
ncbi:MAG: hypothetical protein ACE5JZ_12380 [Kiloniellales bacterium]